MSSIAVVNAGSSSIKFAVLSVGARSAPASERPDRGHRREAARETVRCRKANASCRRSLAEEGFDHAAATQTMMRIAAPRLAGRDISAVGHRVVHGGADYSAPLLLNDEIIGKLATFIPLAPLHQPHNLAVIRAIRASHPELPQVACFDTAFHRGQPAIAQAFAFPENIHSMGSGATASTAFRMNMFRAGSKRIAPELAIAVSSSRTLETARASAR